MSTEPKGDDQRRDDMLRRVMKQPPMTREQLRDELRRTKAAGPKERGPEPAPKP